MDKELKKRLDRAFMWANVWGIMAIAAFILDKSTMAYGPILISLVYLVQGVFIMIKLRRK